MSCSRALETLPTMENKRKKQPRSYLVRQRRPTAEIFDMLLEQLQDRNRQIDRLHLMLENILAEHTTPQAIPTIDQDRL